MRSTFFWVATLYGFFLWIVALVWVVFPASLYWAWGMDESDASRSLSLRVAALVAGWGLILFLARRQPPSPARRAISYGSAFGNLAAAVTGIASLASGWGGWGLLLPVAIEATAAAAFIVAERRRPLTP